MESKKTILIFGISSMLGSSLAEILKKDFRIVGTYYETPVHIKGVLSIKCDVHSRDMVRRVAFLFKPDITIYAIGLTDLRVCQEFPKVAEALNTNGVFNVSMASERYNSKFVYFSSGYIFSGENIYFRENDTPMPSSIYGNTIASAEFYIQKSCLNYLIFRSCPIFGRSYNPQDIKWIEAIERNEFLGERIVCDDSVYTGFIDIYTISEYLKMAIERNITNRLFQVSSRDTMTRYQFAKKYMEVIGGNETLLSRGDWKFPQTENNVGRQEITDPELHFNMDVYNLEKEFEIYVPTVEETIKSYLKHLEGSIKAKRGVGAGISFI